MADKSLTSGSVLIPAATGTQKRILYGAAGALLFAALTFVGANIVIPLPPVPITLQTLFVLLAGAVLGGRFGSMGQFVYLSAGTLGLPVFAGQFCGWGIVAGPTGGYLLSFIVTPFLVGALIKRSSSIMWQAAVFSLGTLVIFAMGVAHLTWFYTHNFAAALSVGVLPFIPGAVFKIVAAVSIYRSITALKKYRRGHYKSHL